MLVRCPSCETEFSLDDRQIGPEGVAVRCSVCSHVFRADPGTPADDGAWQIRTTEDLLFTAPDLASLLQWIREGRLHPDDQVSRTGRNWLALREMPEFSASFPTFADLRPLMTLSEIPAHARAEASAKRRITQIGPASMLEVVTQAVQSPTFTESESRPAEAKAVVRPVAATSPALAVAPAQVRAAAETTARLTPQLEAVDEAARRSAGRVRTERLLFVSAGLLGGVLLTGALVVGVMLLRGRGGDDGGRAVDPAALARTVPEVDAAVIAAWSLDPIGMGHAEARLQARLDEGDLEPLVAARMKLAQTELLATRSLEQRIAADVQRLVGESEGPAMAAAQARTLADAAAKIFEGTDTEGIADREALARTRATLRLAEGRTLEEIGALLGPEDRELAALVQASLLWNDPAASVPVGLVESLQGLARPGQLARLALAHAHARAGDRPKAAVAAAAVLATLPGQPVAQKIAHWAESSPVAVAPVTALVPHPVPVPSDPPPAVVPTPKPATDAATPELASVDSLIDRGCSRVEAGDARAGVELLQLALKRRPTDIDAGLCLAQAQRALGQLDAAVASYERVLARSSEHGVALRGAAATAERLGRVEQALRYYERLLRVDPSDKAAREFVDRHEPSAPASNPATSAPARMPGTGAPGTSAPGTSAPGTSAPGSSTSAPGVTPPRQPSSTSAPARPPQP